MVSRKPAPGGEAPSMLPDFPEAPLKIPKRSNWVPVIRTLFSLTLSLLVFWGAVYKLQILRKMDGAVTAVDAARLPSAHQPVSQQPQGQQANPPEPRKEMQAAPPQAPLRQRSVEPVVPSDQKIHQTPRSTVKPAKVPSIPVVKKDVANSPVVDLQKPAEELPEYTLDRLAKEVIDIVREHPVPKTTTAAVEAEWQSLISHLQNDIGRVRLALNGDLIDVKVFKAEGIAKEFVRVSVKLNYPDSPGRSLLMIIPPDRKLGESRSSVAIPFDIIAQPQVAIGWKPGTKIEISAEVKWDHNEARSTAVVFLTASKKASEILRFHATERVPLGAFLVTKLRLKVGPDEFPGK